MTPNRKVKKRGKKVIDFRTKLGRFIQQKWDEMFLGNFKIRKSK